MASLSRTGRRYLRRAGETSHDFQVFLDENPMVAQGLATVGSLVMNAVMQSKYGPMVQDLMNPGSTTAAPADAAAKPAAMPKAPKGKVARKKPMALKPAAKKTAKKRVLKKKAVRRKVAKKKAA